MPSPFLFQDESKSISNFLSSKLYYRLWLIICSNRKAHATFSHTDFNYSSTIAILWYYDKSNRARAPRSHRKFHEEADQRNTRYGQFDTPIRKQIHFHATLSKTNISVSLCDYREFFTIGSKPCEIYRHWIDRVSIFLPSIFVLRKDYFWNEQGRKLLQ